MTMSSMSGWVRTSKERYRDQGSNHHLLRRCEPSAGSSACTGGDVFRDAPLVILDEPTAALDAKAVSAPGWWPGQVIAMALGPIPTVIGGPAVLVAVRIGVTPPGTPLPPLTT